MLFPQSCGPAIWADLLSWTHNSRAFVPSAACSPCPFHSECPRPSSQRLVCIGPRGSGHAPNSSSSVELLCPTTYLYDSSEVLLPEYLTPSSKWQGHLYVVPCHFGLFLGSSVSPGATSPLGCPRLIQPPLPSPTTAYAPDLYAPAVLGERGVWESALLLSTLCLLKPSSSHGSK